MKTKTVLRLMIPIYVEAEVEGNSPFYKMEPVEKLVRKHFSLEPYRTCNTAIAEEFKPDFKADFEHGVLVKISDVSSEIVKCTCGEEEMATVYGPVDVQHAATCAISKIPPHTTHHDHCPCRV